MERNTGIPQSEILNKILELSLLQRQFLEENRLAEMLACQLEREDLFENLGRLAENHRGLASEIIESDKLLSLMAGSRMDEIRAKISQVRAGVQAVKAYGVR